MDGKRPRLVDGVVTLEWLKWYANGPGGYNARQLAALGISWPPTKGWLRGLVGERVTADQAERFERFSKTQRVGEEQDVCPYCGSVKTTR